MSTENENRENISSPEKETGHLDDQEENTAAELDITNPDYYQNRELSWLDFNYRVIAEAEDERNPLIEQLSFLSIGSSNLDEFIQVRVAGLQDQVKYGADARDTKKQWTPAKQLEEIAKKNAINVNYQYKLFAKKMAELEEKFDFYIRPIEDLTVPQYQRVVDIFDDYIKPAITPFGVDAYRPFPHLVDGAIHLFVRLEKEGEPFIAIIPVPQLLSRFHLLEEEDGAILVFTEDIIKSRLEDFFIGFEIKYSFNFRVTRSADLELQEDGAEDLLSVIEDYLEIRKNQEVVRLEIDRRIEDSYFIEDVVYLMTELNLKEQDVYAIDGPLDLTFLMDVRSLLKDEFPEQAYAPFQAYYPEYLRNCSIFEVAEQRDILLHHPFDSFEPVIELVAEAARDNDTVAIKQTLYRVSSDSPLISNLKAAAKRGIQVTVLVELKARFDEENNVHWAKELEEAGVHILYGMKELKTHSKATLIIKKSENGFKHYAHLGTGNYNESTAKQYTDLGYITTRSAITEDVAAFFNYLSGYSKQPDYHHLHVSPYEIRDTFMEKLDIEIENQREYGNGHMIAKVNSLSDKELIMKLIEASQAGVKIDLIVRGICCAIPGIPDVTENITIRSIVGRYLEHTRIYYFYNNGEPKIYLSSADLMTRNLSRRVEIAFPIQTEEQRESIMDILKLYLADNTKAWELHSDARYYKVQPEEGEQAISAQEVSIEEARDKKQEVKQSQTKNWFSRLTDKLLGNSKS